MSGFFNIRDADRAALQFLWSLTQLASGIYLASTRAAARFQIDIQARLSLDYRVVAA